MSNSPNLLDITGVEMDGPTADLARRHINDLRARLAQVEAERDAHLAVNAKLVAECEEAAARVASLEAALFLIAHWLDAGLPTDDRDVRAIVQVATAALSESEATPTSEPELPEMGQPEFAQPRASRRREP